MWVSSHWSVILQSHREHQTKSWINKGPFTHGTQFRNSWQKHFGHFVIVCGRNIHNSIEKAGIENAVIESSATFQRIFIEFFVVMHENFDDTSVKLRLLLNFWKKSSKNSWHHRNFYAWPQKIRWSFDETTMKLRWRHFRVKRHSYVIALLIKYPESENPAVTATTQRNLSKKYFPVEMYCNPWRVLASRYWLRAEDFLGAIITL